MKKILFRAFGQALEVDDVPEPSPRAGEAVVRIARCGVCGTDLHTTSGHGYTLPAGSGLGHEFAGEVVAVGPDVTHLKPGDHVASMPFSGCGACDYCRTGFFYFCPDKQSYSEGLSQYALVGARTTSKLPATVSLADGALVEPLAVGRKAVRLAGLTPEARVLVFGAGPIGLAVVLWARRAGVRNIGVVARSLRREAMARRMGAEHVWPDEEATTAAVTAALGGQPDVVFECAGVPNVIAKAIDHVRRRGRIISLGYCTKPDTFIPANAMMKDITMQFSVVYDLADFEASADALAADADRARAMVTQTVSIADFPDAFEALRNGADVCKMLMDPWK